MKNNTPYYSHHHPNHNANHATPTKKAKHELHIDHDHYHQSQFVKNENNQHDQTTIEFPHLKKDYLRILDKYHFQNVENCKDQSENVFNQFFDSMGEVSSTRLASWCLLESINEARRCDTNSNGPEKPSKQLTAQRLLTQGNFDPSALRTVSVISADLTPEQSAKYATQLSLALQGGQPVRPTTVWDQAGGEGLEKLTDPHGSSWFAGLAALQTEGTCSLMELAVEVGKALLQVAHSKAVGPGQILKVSTERLNLSLTVDQAATLFERARALLPPAVLGDRLLGTFEEMLAQGVQTPVESKVELLEPLLESPNRIIREIARSILQELLRFGPRASETFLAKLMMASETQQGICLLSVFEGLRFWRLPADVCQALFTGLFPLLPSSPTSSCAVAMAGCAAHLGKLSRLGGVDPENGLSEGHIQFLLQYLIRESFLNAFDYKRNPYLQPLRKVCLGIPEACSLALPHLIEKIKELKSSSEIKVATALVAELAWNADESFVEPLIDLIKLPLINQSLSCGLAVLSAILRVQVDSNEADIDGTMQSALSVFNLNNHSHNWAKYRIGIEAALCNHYSLSKRVFAELQAASSSEITFSWLLILEAMCSAEEAVEEAPRLQGKWLDLTPVIHHIIQAQDHLELCKSDDPERTFEFPARWIELRLQSLLLLRHIGAVCCDSGPEDIRASGRSATTRKQLRLRRIPKSIRLIAKKYSDLLNSSYGADPQTHATLVSAVVMWKLLHIAFELLLSEPSVAEKRSKKDGSKDKDSITVLLQRLRKWRLMDIPGQRLRKVCIHCLSSMKEAFWKRKAAVVGLPTISAMVQLLSSVPWSTPKRFFSSLPCLNTSFNVHDEKGNLQRFTSANTIVLDVPQSQKIRGKLLKIEGLIDGLPKPDSKQSIFGRYTGSVALKIYHEKKHQADSATSAIVMNVKSLKRCAIATQLRFHGDILLSTSCKIAQKLLKEANIRDTFIVSDPSLIHAEFIDQYENRWRIGKLRVSFKTN